MAKVKIQGHASGTGILTVTAPNTSTDRTITLPDSTGTLATTTGVTGIQNDAADADTIWIDANENVGIGQAPDAWRSVDTALDIGDCSAIMSHTSNYTYVAHNWYDDGTDKYKTTAAAAAVELSHQGDIQFKNAASGSADAAITWSIPFIVHADGRAKSQFTAKAWFNMNGTGTPAYRQSHNMSSITDNGTGYYDCSFTNNMTSVDFTVSGTADMNSENTTSIRPFPHAASSIRFQTITDSTITDCERVYVTIFGE